jgi:hypothetical protein
VIVLLKVPDDRLEAVILRLRKNRRQTGRINTNRDRPQDQTFKPRLISALSGVRHLTTSDQSTPSLGPKFTLDRASLAEIVGHSNLDDRQLTRFCHGT